MSASAQSLELAHQGRVLDADGEPLQGVIRLDIALYAQATNGTSIWSASYPDTPVTSGYYSVMLGEADNGLAIQDALFAEAGDVWVEVTAAGSTQSPRSRIASVPDSLIARSVRTPGTVIAPQGDLVLRTLSDTSCDTVGAIGFHPVLQSVLVCDGTEYVSVNRKTVASVDGVRRWSDLTYASSCNDYRTSEGGSYAGDVGSGLYRIDPDGNGSMDVYCDMVTDGGGWTLVMNLSSGTGGRKDWGATSFWTGVGIDGSDAAALTSDYKSRAFDRLTAQADLMVYVHDQGTTEYGYAIYPLLTAHRSKSMHTLMNSGTNFVPVSDASERVVTQSIGTTLNVHRPQSLHGDIFINHAGALSFNDTSGWDADQNDVRIATTLTNAEYPHTFAGLGIDHVESTWRGVFESAPISAYCAVNDGYGNVSQGDPAGGANFPYETGCTLDNNSTFTYRQVDHAIFVR